LLLKGIIKHGWGNWETIHRDKELDIWNTVPPPIKEKETKKDKDSKIKKDNDDEENEDTDSDRETSKNKKNSKRKSKDNSEYKNKKIQKEKEFYPKTKIFESRIKEVIAVLLKEPTPEIEESEEENDEKQQRSQKKLSDVERDENGLPTMPMRPLKGVTVLSLGRIEYERDGFHNAKYIWPIGFKSERKHPSMLNPEVKVMYTNEIIDGGKYPMFKVTAADEPNRSMTGGSASAAWKNVLDEIKKTQKKDGKPTRQTSAVSGPEFFGYAIPTIAKCIQELPDVDKLKSYVKVSDQNNDDETNEEDEKSEKSSEKSENISNKTRSKKQTEDEDMDDTPDEKKLEAKRVIPKK